MVHSLHSHSGDHCAHAIGKLEDIIERAVELGFETYGMTEHMPRSREQDLYPEEVEARMSTADTLRMFREFYAHARSLQAKYKGRIALLVGMETENIHAGTIDEIRAIRVECPVDYLVGSVHHVHGFPIDYDKEGFARLEAFLVERELGIPAGQPLTAEQRRAGTEAAFHAYFDAQYELIRQLRPTVVGHFDLINMFRIDHPLTEATLAKIDRNIDAIVEYGGLVEINSQGWRKGLPGPHPQREIIQRMIPRGVRFCLSDDSHGPLAVATAYRRVHDYLAEVGIHQVFFPKLAADGSLTIESLPNVLSHPFWDNKELDD
ncbi:hypothetical protein HK105_205068 [Polyrhizophydium stewartii]|uniref:Histidinol-phosphatase n=1 Tax=Polyrhizophydium stewartii TaxID=2732419 RepID=A0ABR4N7E5_9FUNG|nr:histidinolphosphatase [Polyrhizophydium stewartii]